VSDLLSRVKQAVAQGAKAAVPEVSSSRYQYLEVATGPFVNRTSKFIVILGYDVAGGGFIIQKGASNFTAVSFSGSGLVSQAVEPTPPATTITILDGLQSTTMTSGLLQRPLLLPPGWECTAVQFFGVVCDTLDDALAIL